MSYDVSIGNESFNITSNVSTMFYDHIPQIDARGGLSEIDGKTGRAAFDILSEAMDRIDSTRIRLWRTDVVGEPDFCSKYDAPNGWGSAIGGIMFLIRVMAACVRNPRSKVRVYS